MQVDQAAVLDALKVVRDPDLNRDIVSLGFIKDLRVDGGRVAFTIELTTPACPVKDQMRDQARAAVSAIAGVTGVDVQMSAKVREAVGPETGKQPLPTVKNVIAVGAGKGGVGKTTVAVNLAIALAKCGSRVGIIDGDTYGPNVPIMLGMREQLQTDGQKIIPAEKYGVQVISMGFLTSDDAPIIWRGPMLHGALQQLFREVRWGSLDYLIVDLPPGTGDVALSLSQTVPVAGAIVVTTPQQVSLADSRRAIALYRKLNTPPPAQGSSLPSSIMEPYLTIEEALVKDDIAPVRQNAGNIATAATALGAPAMRIQTGAAQLASADDLETAREKFGILSDAMVTYMDGNKLNGGEGVKIAYCPMQKKPWMQKGDALANPYYGASSEMATCGNFR